MKRLPAVLVCFCTFGTTIAGSAHAESPTLGHSPNESGAVQFADALNAEETARESFLNVSPDLDLLKPNRTKQSGTDRKATVNVNGLIRNNVGSPLCGLVLANGQFMFSCSPNGTFSLDVPQDSAGQVTLFGFVDGHFPYKVVFSGGRWDMTLNIANVAPPPPPPPATTSVITFTITDGCNNGVPIDYKFFDETNNLVWPSASTHYTTIAYDGVYTHNLTCNNFANICFGARSGSFYWGVDVNNTKSCADCCITCQSGYSLSRRLTC